MTSFAIVGIGGKQYRVAEGETVRTELIGNAEPGKKLHLQHVFMAGGKIGAPLVDGAKVEVEVIETGKGDKIRVFKMKRRKRLRVNRGHRQPFALLKVLKIHA